MVFLRGGVNPQWGYLRHSILAGSGGVVVAGTLTGSAGRLQGRCMHGSWGPVAGQWSTASSLVLHARIVIWSFGRPYCAGDPDASLCSSLSDEARGRTVQYHDCDPSYLAIGQSHSFGSYLAAA